LHRPTGSTAFSLCHYDSRLKSLACTASTDQIRDLECQPSELVELLGQRPKSTR